MAPADVPCMHWVQGYYLPLEAYASNLAPTSSQWYDNLVSLKFDVSGQLTFTSRQQPT